MKKQTFTSLAIASVFLGMAMSAPVFAVNPYGIDYSGGQDLGTGNVSMNPGLIDGLTPLIGGELTVAVQSGWQKAYVRWGESCHPFSYVKVWENNQFAENELKYTVSHGDYMDSISIKNIAVEDLNASESAPTTVGINMTNGWIFAGWGKDMIFSDNKCTNSISSNFISLSPSTGGRIFVETTQKLIKRGESNTFTSNELYYGITDIDAAQSYKIMNNDVKLTAENMIAKSAAALQDNRNYSTNYPSTNSLKNKYVANGNYIYSEYDVSIGWPYSTDGEGGDVFVKVPVSVQEEGLDVVYGFARHAGSGLGFYTKQYIVKYVSDGNGLITGLANEDVFSGNNPTGSESTPNDNYELDYWTADKDVVLDDGAVIKADEPITMAQIKNVVVSEDLIFTAHHKTIEEEEEEPAMSVPNTGHSTGEANGIGIGVPVAVITLGALLISIMPKLTHKKINFKK